MLSFSSSFLPTCFLASRTIFLPLDSRFSASPFAYRPASSSPLLNHAGLLIIIIKFNHSDAAWEFNYAPILESMILGDGGGRHDRYEFKCISPTYVTTSICRTNRAIHHHIQRTLGRPFQ